MLNLWPRAVVPPANNGAKVAQQKQEIPGIGFAAYILDPQGNKVGLFEPVEQEPS